MTTATSTAPGPLTVALAAVRPRTLGLSIAPVLLGTALAFADGHRIDAGTALLALACSLLLQVGTNLHNDAADGERGTDAADRIGPLRVTAVGWARAAVVRRAAAGVFAAALLAGLPLVARGGAWVLVAGLASLATAWCYSGGPRPLSRSPFGEAAVLVFFGLVAVVGSHRLQVPVAAAGAVLDTATARAVLLGAFVGLQAAAVLLVNNYRDLESDVRSGRRTLVALIGRPAAARLQGWLLLAPYALATAVALSGHPGALLACLGAPSAARLARGLDAAPPGAWLNARLAATAALAAATTLLAALGLAGEGLSRAGIVR